MAQAPQERTPHVSVPTGVSVFPHEIFQPPREWVQRQFADLRLWREHLGRGPGEDGDLLDPVTGFAVIFVPLR